MIDLALFAGRVLLVVVLYLFLFAAMRTGIGLVGGTQSDSAWSVDVEKGPRYLRGRHYDILGPTVIGRSPSSDICLDDPHVSSVHAQFRQESQTLVIEDLGSTNGTMVNGHYISQPVTLRDGDEVQVSDVIMRISINRVGR